MLYLLYGTTERIDTSFRIHFNEREARLHEHATGSAVLQVQVLPLALTGRHSGTAAAPAVVRCPGQWTRPGGTAG